MGSSSDTWNRARRPGILAWLSGSYLTAAEITQALLLLVLWFVARKMPISWQRPAAGVLLVAGIGWFARMLL